MKVASKIILVACLAFLPILCVHTWLALEREEALFRSDMEHDLSVLGVHLRNMAAAEGRRSGVEGVRSVVEAAARADRSIAIEWKPGPGERRGIRDGTNELVWVEPVRIDAADMGQIVLTESLGPMRAYLRSTVLRLGALMVLLIAGGLLVARLLSVRLIGRRLDRLVSFAEETGAGRLGGRVNVGGDDEITYLGASLEAMSEKLDQARVEAQRSNDERVAMLQQLRHTDRLASLGRLAGSVAHELGTPLNIVLGHANRIASGDQDPFDTKESATTIHRQVRKMEAIIRDILGFARQAPGEEQAIDVRLVVESVCGLLRPLARRRDVKLRVDGTPASASIFGRVLPFEQALSNLVSNAIDASPAAAQVVVSIAREERPAKVGERSRPVVVTRVLDQGPGVPEAETSRIFEAFYTSKGAGQGTGLGLWLAEGIVRDHGGSIEVENRSEGGACFAIVMPDAERA